MMIEPTDNCAARSPKQESLRVMRIGVLAMTVAAAATAGLALAAAAPIAAHTGGGVTAPQEMQALIREMSRELDRLSGQMGEASSPESRQRVAGRMREISGSLQRMSGLLPQPGAGVDKRMARLEAAIDELDAQMERVRAASNPVERARLVGEHTRSLRQIVAEVREAGRAFGPQMRAMMGGGTKVVSGRK